MTCLIALASGRDSAHTEAVRRANNIWRQRRTRRRRSSRRTAWAGGIVVAGTDNKFEECKNERLVATRYRDVGITGSVGAERLGEMLDEPRTITRK